MALKVRDLLRRRSSLAEEVALAGEAGGASGVEVVSVENLVIPVGVDWTGENRHYIGSFEIPPYALYALSLYFETATEQDDVNRIDLAAYSPDLPGPIDSASVGFEGEFGRFGSSWAMETWGEGMGILDVPQDSYTVDISIGTSGVETTEEITVVLARAGLFLI